MHDFSTIALARVLKKERLDSLGADTLMKYQKCKILIVMTVINRTCIVGLYTCIYTYTLKRKSLNVEGCGHEIRNEFHWSKKSRGTQAIIIAAQDRTSYAAVTYERSVSTAGSDAMPRLVQLL